jgi:hypothetical protein
VGRVAILIVEHAHQHLERTHNPARASAHDNLSGCWAGRFLNQKRYPVSTSAAQLIVLCSA